MIPNYLKTFRRAVRELEGNEKNELDEKSTPLISLNSFNSYPAPSQKAGEGGRASEQKSVLRTLRTNQVQEGGAYEKNELNEKRVTPSFPYADALDRLERRCPDDVPPERWQQCLIDAQRFLAAWGDKALALGWTNRDLFGLHRPPAKPHPAYSRLSRYDAIGLLWLLQGRRVIALTDITAAIQSTSSAVLTYRKARGLREPDRLLLDKKTPAGRYD
jgi:hypothetical protein